MAAMVARRRLERGVKLNHPESGRAHHRFRRRGRARRPLGRGTDGGRRACADGRSGDGRRRLDDPRHPGRGDFSRRHEAGHRPPSDPRRRRQAYPRRGAGRARRHRHERGPRDGDARGREHRRPADPGRLALSFLRDQSGAEIRAQARRRASGSTFRPGRRSASSPARAAACGSSRSRANARSTASARR